MNVEVFENEKPKIVSALQKRADACSLYAVKYLEFGVSTIRVLCYTIDIIPLLQRQLGYALRDNANHYDGTIVAWKDHDMDALFNDVFSICLFRKVMRVRAEMLWARKGNYSFVLNLFEEGFNRRVIGRVYSLEQIEYFDAESKTAFFSCNNYDPEDFVKNGHVFVRQINRLIETNSVNLTHGAVFGYAGNGFLLCGRGKRGKSTLTVESMLQGFEYVSDDYQILKKTDDGLFAYPIYSIVTLSYRMYNEMYDRFQGKFVCNNFSQDKYLFNIAPYHSQFRTDYPIRFCMFPEIVSDEHPSIAPCNPEEKGRAVIHLIHSTLFQMDELGEPDTVRKLLFMVWDKPFVIFHLCNNISENTEYLKQYLKSMPDLLPDAGELPPSLLDITDDTATILDTRTCRFTQMNKLASNVFALVLSGYEPSLIRERLAQFEKSNPDILAEFDGFLELIKSRDCRSFTGIQYCTFDRIPEFAAECDYRLSATEIVGTEAIELIDYI